MRRGAARAPQVGFASWNRKPNIMYIHQGLAKGVQMNGFDPNRPRVGCVIDFKSDAGREKLRKDTLPSFWSGARLTPLPIGRTPRSAGRLIY